MAVAPITFSATKFLDDGSSKVDLETGRPPVCRAVRGGVVRPWIASFSSGLAGTGSAVGAATTGSRLDGVPKELAASRPFVGIGVLTGPAAVVSADVPLGT